MEQNWENIIEVLKEEQYPSRFMNMKKIILTEEQKVLVKAYCIFTRVIRNGKEQKTRYSMLRTSG
jgi:Trp operon repressor